MSRQELLEKMVKDLFDAVEHFYGTDGLGKVVDQMKFYNRLREDRMELDALEDMLNRHCPVQS